MSKDRVKKVEKVVEKADNEKAEVPEVLEPAGTQVETEKPANQSETQVQGKLPKINIRLSEV